MEAQAREEALRAREPRAKGQDIPSPEQDSDSAGAVWRERPKSLAIPRSD